ncbi:uncharacterized protein LOC143626856 [Bidens hawaiensis]|uniref:uncharacterized protein LOC143626856 n=1 Tax=Bidens hawaiensis TaxID=980011 RepID=UPI00404B34E8
MADDLEIGSNSKFTFMSDRQKGLLQAIQTLFPHAGHRYCLRHIHENMKLAGYRGVLYKNMLYKCATSTTKPEFLTAINELKEFNKEAHLWLSKIAPQSWSRSHYSGLAISDVMINNMCEVYNGKIVEARDRPIISALEYVREYLMRRIVTVLGIIDKCEGLLTPRATQLFEAIQKQANHYSVQWNGGDLYEVSGKPIDPRVANLAMRTCSCKGWEITGMLCRHAVAALWFMATNRGRVGALESLVHPVHAMDMWKLVYSFKVNSINGMTLWTKCEAPTTIVAPKHHTMAGRPKKARKRSVVENDDIPATGKLTRKNTFGACSRCGSTCHNVRTCTGPLKKKGKKGSLMGSCFTRSSFGYLALFVAALDFIRCGNWLWLCIVNNLCYVNYEVYVDLVMFEVVLNTLTSISLT